MRGLEAGDAWQRIGRFESRSGVVDAPVGLGESQAPDTARPPVTADEARRRAGDGRPSLWRKEHGNGSAPRFASSGRAQQPGGTTGDACRGGGCARERPAGTDTCRGSADRSRRKGSAQGTAPSM